MLPVSLILAGLFVTGSLLAHSLWPLAVGTLLWRIPYWSVDQNARGAAPGVLTSQSWLLGALPSLVAAVALIWWVRVYPALGREHAQLAPPPPKAHGGSRARGPLSRSRPGLRG